MAKEKKEHYASYRALPYKSRFWLYPENCYTKEDLALREWILKTRANSGIDADYLSNPSSWFTEDKQALINVNDRAWIFSDAFKARHVLSKDDFHVQPFDNQWPALYDLMQNVGDYLILRNQNLPADHLNQPMNYAFLDINFILKRLSQNPDIAHVRAQLELLNRYVRQIEKNIPPTVGSDRLFLANFRRIIDDKIEPQLTHLIESQLLKERLDNLSRTIKKLSGERNRILHFALNINPVNPHPYEFSITDRDDAPGYPTQAAKKCGTSGHEIAGDLTAVLHLTIDQLKECPNFNLISMNEEILGHYAAAVSDLNELERFQQVISQVMDLLSQAGEVYTVYQFKEQMLSLLQQIEGFIDESSQPIEAIINANTQAYHKAIQAEENLSLWQTWLTSEKQKLKTFIQNQDTLAQFPSSSADLVRTNKALKAQVSEVARHLSQPDTKKVTFDDLIGQTQELNKLMHSMHQWITIHHEIKGLEAPAPIQLLPTLPPQAKSTPKPVFAPELCPKSIPSRNSFFAHQALPVDVCPPNNSECQIKFINPQPIQNEFLFLGLMALIPVGAIALYLLINWRNKKEVSVFSGDKDEFEELVVKIEDLVAIIKGMEATENEDRMIMYEPFLDTLDTLKRDGLNGHYNLGELQELYDDLDYFFHDMYTSPPYPH